MSRKKDFQIRQIKRVRVFPHIILLILFCGFFSLAFVAIQAWYIATILDNKATPYFFGAREMAAYIEEHYENHVEDFSGDDSGFTNATYVIQKKKQCIATNYDRELVPSDFVEFSVTDSFELYFEKSEETFDFFADEDTINPVPLLENYFRRYRIENPMNPFEGNQMFDTVFSFPGWIKLDLFDGEYVLFYKADIELLHKDVMMIIIVGAITVALVTVPMILYLITLILSLAGQRRAAKALYFDPLTGGKNWLYFSQHAYRLLGKSRKRKNLNYVMVSLRMDKYQNYCMCYSAKEGEELIERLANAFKKQKLVGRKELYARYSEAEFGLLLRYQNEAELEARIENMKTALMACAPGRKIDFSAGICEPEQDYRTATLYGNASIARKNIAPEAMKRIAWYNEELKNNQLWEHYVEDQMESALANGEFQMYIQPKYSAKTRTLGGGEALIRWVSPKDGIISPGRFIPIFEKNGFITKIDDFMIETLARYQAKWISEGRKVVPISVNVSRAHFARPDLAEHILEIVERTGAPKDVIELELTESAFFQDREILISIVSKLREYGFKVSMDDFGADYSSLNSLKDMPMDVIKLDAGFFRGKEENEERGSVIVAGIIDLAKQLDMHIVAEGIEHGEQVDFLAEHGCDLIQGFYFAKPMPVDEYEKLSEVKKSECTEA